MHWQARQAAPVLVVDASGILEAADGVSANGASYNVRSLTGPARRCWPGQNPELARVVLKLRTDDYPLSEQQQLENQ